MTWWPKVRTHMWLRILVCLCVSCVRHVRAMIGARKRGLVHSCAGVIVTDTAHSCAAVLVHGVWHIHMPG